jgi:hypothetical protein
MSSNFNCGYMAMSSLTCNPGFCVEFFVQPIYTDYANAMFGLIWFSGFRGKDLNVIFYQNMPNLHNRYKSAERKISQKKTEYMLNYSLQKQSTLEGSALRAAQVPPVMLLLLQIQ